MSAGSRWRLLRFLQSLRFTEVPRHFQLLIRITATAPGLAAALLGSLPLDLEPHLSSRWLAGMAAASQLLQHAIDAPTPFMDRAHRCLPNVPLEWMLVVWCLQR